MERPYEINQIQTQNPGKAKWLVKKTTWKKCPINAWLTPPRGCDSLSLSSPMCLSTCTFFPPKKHFPCFTTFCLYVEILFYRALLLVNFPDDLVARIQHSPLSLLNTKLQYQPKSCLKQQAKATQNQFYKQLDNPGLTPRWWIFTLVLDL